MAKQPGDATRAFRCVFKARRAVERGWGRKGEKGRGGGSFRLGADLAGSRKLAGQRLAHEVADRRIPARARSGRERNGYGYDADVGANMAEPTGKRQEWLFDDDDGNED